MKIYCLQKFTLEMVSMLHEGVNPHSSVEFRSWPFPTDSGACTTTSQFLWHSVVTIDAVETNCSHGTVGYEI